MGHFKTLATAAALAGALFAFGGAARAQDTPTGFYLAYERGVSVSYLALNGSGSGISGYLEAIKVSGTQGDGQIRAQTPAGFNDSVLSFGAATAVRTGSGYTLTTMTPSGQIRQQLFVHTSARAVNASIVALSASVESARLKNDRLSAKAQLDNYRAISVADAARLSRAQVAVETAAAQLTTAQAAADRLSALAMQARGNANAALDKSGVSLTQNQSRMDAMKLAGDAEQNVLAAQHLADLAEANVGKARAEVVHLRARIADAAQRTATLTARLSSDELAGR